MSQVVLVLVSQESKGREWTNFEAGFGDGAECLVIPVAIKNFPLGQLSFPLSGYQGRKIEDIDQIIEDIRDRTGSQAVHIDQHAYASEILEAESNLIYKTIVVRPKWNGQQLQFEIQNAGNIDVELLMLEVRIPADLIPEGTPFGHWYDTQTTISPDGIRYRWLACYSSRGVYLALEPCLRPFLTPSMGPVLVERFRIPFKLPMTAAQREQSIFFQLHAVGYTTEMQQQKIGDILGIPA